MSCHSLLHVEDHVAGSVTRCVIEVNHRMPHYAESVPAVLTRAMRANIALLDKATVAIASIPSTISRSVGFGSWIA